MNDTEKLLKHLEVVHERERAHHTSLWEEEKHYTWWIYVLAGGLAFLYTRSSSDSDVSDPNVLRALAVILSVLSIAISLGAWRVLHMESQYLHHARQLYHRTILALGLDQAVGRLEKPLDCRATYKDMKTVEQDANKWKWKREDWKDIGVRDVFRATFIVAAMLFVGSLVYSFFHTFP